MLTSMYVWWFTTGWAHLAKSLFAKMGDALSFFSIGSLLRTLFAPYRQISATTTGNDPGSKLSALGDRLVSRLVGAVVRIFLMLTGLLVFIAEFFIFLAFILCWPLIPFLPLAGLILTVLGVVL